jgi:long-subunit acyl-CoA synthetase (AMP-forming)
MRVCALAYGLKSRGIKRGDRVAVICPNVPMILDLIQALPAIHAVIVPMNIRITKPEANYILEHSGASMVIVDHEFKHLAEDFKGQVVVSLDSGGRDSTCPYEVLIDEGRHNADSLGWQGLTLIDDENADFAICYTSGTTGRPKGVVTTYRGTYLAAMANAMESKLDFESTYLWILPAFHALGWTFPFAVTAATAGQVCLRSVGDYSPIWESIFRDRVTVSKGDEVESSK